MTNVELLNIVEKKIANRDCLGAEILCKKVLLTDPSNYFALGFLGIIAVTYRRFNVALTYFKEYLSIRGGHEDIEEKVIFGIADVYAHLPNNVEAKKMYEQALDQAYNSKKIRSHYAKIKNNVLGAHLKNAFEAEDLAKFASENNYSLSTVLKDEELVWTTPALESMVFQMTTKCNLRCVFCEQHWSNEHGQDASEEIIRTVLDFVKANGIKYVGLNTYGETLISKNWPSYAEELLGAGVELGIVTNLSMNLTDQEYTLLSKFKDIAVSVDSADSREFKKIRENSSLEIVLFNMNKIRIAALKESRNPPPIRWVSTMTDRIVPFLKDLVYLANDNGVKRLTMNDLWYYNNREIPLKSIFALTGESFLDAAKHITDAMKLAEDIKIDMNFLDLEWDELFASKVAVEKVKLEQGITVDVVEKPIELKTFINTDQLNVKMFRQEVKVPEYGETRFCLSPWSSPRIYPDGNVYTCCMTVRDSTLAMGKIDSSNSLYDVLNNSNFVDLRAQLLTGQITNPVCLNCNVTQIVPLEILRSKVRQYLYKTNIYAPDVYSKEGLRVFIKALCPEQDISHCQDSLEGLTSFMIDYCAKQALTGNVIEIPEYDFFCHQIRSRILELCKGRSVYIWGVGGRYDELKERFDGININAAFDTSSEKQGTQIGRGIDVFAPDKIATMPPYPIFVCSCAVNEIRAKIKCLSPNAVVIDFDRRKFVSACF